MSTELLFALASAAVALAYGVVSVKWILAQPDGNDRMREISQAIQEGAAAYLNRQYTTIGIVGAILTVVLFFHGLQIFNNFQRRSRTNRIIN